jgi:hypothetical protein
MLADDVSKNVLAYPQAQRHRQVLKKKFTGFEVQMKLSVIGVPIDNGLAI